MVKRVLSLDGGGVRCVFQAQILNDLYPGLRGHQILKKFNLVTATSAGSVVLAGLLENMSPYEIFEDFQKPSFLDAIFSRTWWPFFPKWSTEKKKTGLLKIFPHSTDLLYEKAAAVGLERIVIPAFDVQQGVAYIFDSLDTGGHSYLDAMCATSTAPLTYFDKPALVGTRTYWDGGVTGLNNPAAYGTALLKETYPQEEIHTLSIGSGKIVTPSDLATDHAAFYPNPIKSCQSLIKAMVDDGPDISSRYLWTMTNGNYIRLNPVIGPDPTQAHPKLPLVYFTDATLGGTSGYEILSKASLDSKDLTTIEKLIAVGTHYLEDKIPTQIISRIDLTKVSVVPSKTYSGLKKTWQDSETL